MACRGGTFVIWSPAEVRVVVNQQRERYDPASSTACEVHITLTQPFRRSPSPGDWLRLDEIVSNFDPFEINYGPLNAFLPYPCLYCEIHPVYRVLTLRDALHGTRLFNLSLPHTEGFVPHMTIADNALDPAETVQLCEDLRDSVDNGTFTRREIAYIIPDDRFHFTVERVQPLRGGQ